MSSGEDPLATFAPLHAEDGAPLHRQVEERLRRLAASEPYREGALLPDELTLARRLGVSRGTARAALGRLVQEGVLERRAGVGTRVVTSRPESGIGAWRSLTREMAAKGIQVVNFHTELRQADAPPEVAAALQLTSVEELQRLDRVRGWDGNPVLVSRSWFHPRVRIPGDADWSQPLYDLVERHTGIVAEAAREEFAAVAARGWVARRLGVRAGTPLLLRRHVVTDRQRRPIEYAEVHYVSSRFTLTLDLKRGAR